MPTELVLYTSVFVLVLHCAAVFLHIALREHRDWMWPLCILCYLYTIPLVSGIFTHRCVNCSFCSQFPRFEGVCHMLLRVHPILKLDVHGGQKCKKSHMLSWIEISTRFAHHSPCTSIILYWFHEQTPFQYISLRR